MEIIIDEHAGFCFGVVKAIDTAEEELEHNGTLYCLGDIVHNNAEVQRLRNKGLEVVDKEQFATLGEGARVLIRAHGEPPSTYETARQRGITLIDATCPIVLALQKKIRAGYEEMKQCGGQVVIFGKPGHAEVIGLCGQAENNALIASHSSDIDHIDFNRPIRLYSQTTKSKEEYSLLTENIKRRLAESGCNDFIAYDTLCKRVSNRAVELEKFALSVDVLLFVRGENSSNGLYLYEYCKKVQPRTYTLSDWDEYDAAWLSGANRVGITGATSTPRWLMEDIGKKIARCI